MKSRLPFLLGVAMLVALLALGGVAWAQTTEFPPSNPECNPDEPPPPPPPDDTTAPAMSRTVPASGATGVDRDKNVRVFFSEGMDPATINGATINLYRGAARPANEVSATVRYDATRDKAVLNPSVRLAGRTTYTVVVEGGVGGVEDEAGNPMQGDHVFSFKTGRA